MADVWKPTITWERKIAKLIRDRSSSFSRQQRQRPFLVGIVGIPGSGKTTSCSILFSILSSDGSVDDDDCSDDGDDSASKVSQEDVVVIPMDGYHYPLETLRSFPNAREAIYRRGAPDTFDVSSLKTDLTRIRNGKESIVRIPTFDHSVGDPTLTMDGPRHSFVRKDHTIVICEGLYLLHDEDGWDGISELFDLTIVIRADVDACIERVKKRNKCIPGYTPEEIDVRTDAVDRVNAHTVCKSMDKADIIVDSAML